MTWEQAKDAAMIVMAGWIVREVHFLRVVMQRVLVKVERHEIRISSLEGRDPEEPLDVNA